MLQENGAARLKELKDSVRVLVDPATDRYIALGNEQRQPHLTDQLHLATMAPDTDAGRAHLEALASRRGVACDAIRVDAP